MIGASKINFISKFTSTAVAEVIRKKKGIVAVGNAQVDTAQSKFGSSSILFDGTGDYLQAGSSSDWNLGSSTTWTVEGWLYLSSLPGAWRGVLGCQNQASTLGWGLYINDQNKLVWIPTGTGSANAASSTALTAATWQHWAIVRNGSSFKIFLAGTEIYNNASYPGYSDASDVLNIGRAANISGGYNGYLDYPAGWLDEIRISNTARYTTTFTPSTTAFTNDDNTLLLMHANGTDATTFFEDDNGLRAQRGIAAVGNAQIDTAQSKFGGSSLLGDGTGDYLQLATDSALSLTGDFTMEMWYRIPSTVPAILPFYNSDHLFYLTNDAGTAKYAVFQGGSNRVLTSGVTVSANTWYHVAFVRSGSTITVYHNGTSAGSATWSSTISGTTPTIGSYSSYYLNGWMDEIRISNNARYTTGFTPSTTPFVNDANTVLLVHADGTDATTVFRDDNGARAQFALSAVGNAQVDTAQSKFGGSSALFDGTGDYLTTGANSVTSDLALTGNYWTVEYWARITAHAGAYQATVAVWDAVSPNGSVYYFSTNGYNGTNKMAMEYVYGTNSTSGAVVFGSALSTGVWQHHAFVRNGNTLTAYLDGVSQGTHDMTGRTIDITGYNSSSNTTMALTIGAMTGASGAYNGHLDEIRISNTARYTANFTAPTAQFQNDANTLLLIHADGTDASTVFFDDNGRTTTP